MQMFILPAVDLADDLWSEAMKIIYRSSVDGRIVTKEYAEINKATTEKEVIRERFSAHDLNWLGSMVQIHQNRIEDTGRDPKSYDALLEKIEKVKADTE
jgi:hypothetical protein